MASEQVEQVKVVGKKSKSPSVKRVTTSRSIAGFDPVDIRAGIESLLKKEQIPERQELGPLKKLSHQSLVKYVKPWALANLFVEIVDQIEYRQKNATVLSERQKKAYRALYYHSSKNIAQAVKSNNIQIKDMYSMNKHQLVEAVAILDDKQCKAVFATVRTLTADQEVQRDQVKQEKDNQKELKRKASEEEDVSSSSEDEPKIVNKKKKTSKQ